MVHVVTARGPGLAELRPVQVGEMASRLGLERAYGVQVRFVNDAQLIASTAYLLQSEDASVGILAYRGTEPAGVLSCLLRRRSRRGGRLAPPRR